MNQSIHTHSQADHQLHDPLRLAQQRAPRYTSYPTAAEFEPASSAEFAQHLQRLKGQYGLYVHVPYCKKMCLYCACNRTITNNTKIIERYLAYLHQEIAASEAPAHRAKSIRFGGGTPNVLSVEQFVSIFDHLVDTGWLEPQYQAHLEIDPRITTPGQLKHLADIGFRSVSFGVQDFDPKVQQLIGRIQSVDMTRRCVEEAREAGYASINMDLVVGLPGQTEATLRTTLQHVKALRPDRLALFGYAHLPQRFAAQQTIDPATIPDAALRLALHSLAEEELLAAGYTKVGIDHFVLPHDSLALAQQNHTMNRSFHGYDDGPWQLVGFGPSSVSLLKTGYFQNAVDNLAYRRLIDQGIKPIVKGIAVDPADQVRRTIVMQLMCDFQARLPPMSPAQRAQFAPGLDSLIDAGFASIQHNTLTVTPQGRTWVRLIARCFDRYRSEGEEGFSAVA